MTPLSAWGVFKREKKHLGTDFHFGQDCLELCLSALATKMRWRGSCMVMRWKFKKHVCAF